MDIVIPLLPATGDTHNELRFALRSFEKFIPHDRIVLIGGYPQWGKKMLQLPFRDDPDPKYKEANIFLKLRHYVDKWSKGKEFIFANDDYYVRKPWDSLPPYPHKGLIRTEMLERSTLDPYRKTMKNTLTVVPEGSYNLDVHAPMCMDPNLFTEAFKDISWKLPFGYLLKSIYGAHHKSYFSEDLKYSAPTDLQTLLLNVKGNDVPFWSTNGPAVNETLVDFLLSEYPERSNYEAF